MSAVTDLQAAAARLSKPLPSDFNAPPRLVMTDAETVSGIAFCAHHDLPLEGEYAYTACFNCEVIDCLQSDVAELLHSLLTARWPLAAWLEECIADVVTKPTLLRRALAVAHAINPQTIQEAPND
jgi:hypothetical protein